MTKRHPLELIDSERWNRVVRSVHAAVARGTGIARSSPPRMPWNVRARWNRREERIEFNLKAGLINGGPVKAPPVPFEEANPTTKRRAVFEGLGNVVRNGEIEPYLDEAPWIPVESRRIIPREFTSLPLEDQEALAQFNLDPSSASWSREPETRRVLRSVDFVLLMPRPAAETVVAEDLLGIAASVRGAPGGGPRVTVVSDFEPDPPAPSLVEQIASGRTDPPFERRLIARAYVISGRGVSNPEADLDESWSVFPRHEWFYNKAFAFRVEIGIVAPLNLSLSVPLAGGVAQPTIDAILGDINQQDAEASLLLSKVAVNSRFWDV